MIDTFTDTGILSMYNAVLNKVSSALSLKFLELPFKLVI